MTEKNPIQVAGRLFGVLEYLADHGAAGLMEIAGELGLNKSTTHRVLSSLEYMGYVKQDPDTGKYDTTFKLADLANRAVSRVDIISTVRPHLRRLMERCGETVHFVQLDGSDVVYIDKVEAYQNNVRMVSHVGARIPFYRSAVGKALASRMTKDAVRRLWDSCDIERTTPYTITNFDDFMDALEEVRRKGYALDNEENETGVRCIAAALTTHNEGPKYAFSISVPISRMDNDRIKELSGYVRKVKDEIDAEFHS